MSSSINIRNLKEIIQRQIKDLTDNSSISDLENLMKLSMLSGGGHIETDSADLLSTGRLAFDKQHNRVLVNTSDSNTPYWSEVLTGGTYTEFSTVVPYTFQGSSYGYQSAGYFQPPGLPSGAENQIQKYSFTSDGNATDVGDVTVARYYLAGQSSSTHGYSSGGQFGVNVIDKFPFSTDANATDVGDTNEPRSGQASQSSDTHGYNSGGGTSTTTYEKFAYASDGNGAAVAQLWNQRTQASGQSSSTHGYNSGGYYPPATTMNSIDKFPFAVEENAADVGDMSQGNWGGRTAGQSSETHGYVSGGSEHPNIQRNYIDKFTFATDANATDVGDLTLARYYLVGTSSTTHGYASGGYRPVARDNIDKFSFSSDGNATDVGDLLNQQYGAAAQQI